MDTLRAAVSIACNRALSSTSLEPRVRLWIDGRLDYQALNKLIACWGTVKGDLHERLKQICGPNAVLALNGVAGWNVQVGENLQGFSSVVSDAFGAGGKRLVDTYCFVTSGSAETAFGAHVDFEDSVIVDLSGVGRVVREWPVGAPYGALKNGAAGHLGSSFDWGPYADRSK